MQPPLVIDDSWLHQIFLWKCLGKRRLKSKEQECYPQCYVVPSLLMCVWLLLYATFKCIWGKILYPKCTILLKPFNPTFPSIVRLPWLRLIKRVSQSLTVQFLFPDTSLFKIDYFQDWLKNIFFLKLKLIGKLTK